MKRVFKYQLPILEEVELRLPIGAEVIRIDDLGGMIWLWAIIDDELKDETRKFYLYKTGGEMKDIPLKYLGCGAVFIQMELMLYVFEEDQSNEIR